MKLLPSLIASGLLLIPQAHAQNTFTYQTNTDGSIVLTSFTGYGAVTVPNFVTSIGQRAFSGRNVLNVTIPGSVVNIDSNAFADCYYLTNVTLSVGLQNISSSAFFSCSDLHNFTIPESVTNIGFLAFAWCGLTQIVLPGSLKNTGSSTFVSCDFLTNITLGCGVTDIGDHSFEFCPSLTHINIPASVTNIESGAFQDSSALSNVYFFGNAPGTNNTTNIFNGESPNIYYLAGTTGWGSTFDGLATTLWNPPVPINTNFGMRNNQFGFDITGPGNIPVTVQVCTNLATGTWTNLATLSLNNGSIHFTDPRGATASNCFYRVWSVYP